jgi:hypothetical protein
VPTYLIRLDAETQKFCAWRIRYQLEIEVGSRSTVLALFALPPDLTSPINLTEKRANSCTPNNGF